MKICARVILAVCTVIGINGDVTAQSVGVPIVGEIESITIADIADPWSSGAITVAGQRVVIPRNLLIDLPANRVTLQELFAGAPPQCVNAMQTGLAQADGCRGRRGALATINANRIACGDVVAGEVLISKDPELLSGIVTFINHTDGSFRINGLAGADGGGTLVRINDPVGRHTVQQGLGCGPGANCSPDARFVPDTDNYTITFATGYPACLPSTVAPRGLRTVGSTGPRGDPFCPETNRGSGPNFVVPDATRFAPIQVGDHLLVEGHFETVQGVKFLSVWHLTVSAALVTRDDPSQPDYILPAEGSWDAPGFANARARLLLIGFTTLPASQLDVYALRVDPLTNTSHEMPLASTVGNPGDTNICFAAQGGCFKIRYDVDFIVGAKANLSPCSKLANAGFSVCSGGGLAAEFSVLSPISREILYRTRRARPLTPGVVARDIQGLEAPSGRYLTPIVTNHPEFTEINLNALATPFIFEGEPWHLDRRLSPHGCIDGACEGTPQPLTPFPASGLDPGTEGNPPAPDAPLTFFTFDASGVATPHRAALSTSEPACSAPPVDPGPPGGGGPPIVNLPPVAHDDVFSSSRGAPVTFAAADLLANDSDPNGDPLTLQSIAPISVGGGIISTTAGGRFVYTPAIGFAGADSFTYVVMDPSAATAVGLVRVSVPDTSLPTAAVSSPAAAASVAGTVTITATATDNVAVIGVRFFLDDVALGPEVATPPYQFSWDTTAVTAGTHGLTATARDAAGNVGTSPRVIVSVNNPVPDTTAPVVSVTAPKANATVRGTISVTATATDNQKVTSVQFKRNGVNLGAADTSAPFATSWNTALFPIGKTVLTAVARDAAGNVTTSAPVTVTIAR